MEVEKYHRYGKRSSFSVFVSALKIRSIPRNTVGFFMNLLAFRIAAVTAEVAARRVLELAAALWALTDQVRH